MRILRVNLTNKTTSYQELPRDWEIIGGRALTAKIISREVPPKADPLGPEAKLVIACGPLAGTGAPSCGRLSIGAKSPLTMGIKEANTGGPVGQKLDRLGIRAIIVEGNAETGSFYLLHISPEETALVKADQYQGLKNYDLAKKVYQNYHPKVSVISIGLAGERKWKAAAITMTDREGWSSRHAARGGLGAVMGAKGLKAIIVNHKGTSRVKIKDLAAFKTTVKKWAQISKKDKQISGMSRFGTTGSISALRWLGSMPTRNYHDGVLPGIENISGEAIRNKNLEQGGKMVACMPGCQVKCTIVYHGTDNKQLTSGLQYQTVALMGTNLGITDPDVIAKLDYLCDDLGIDTIEIGAALGVAADAGKIKMGDPKSILAMIEEIEKGTEMGTILGNGVVETCKKLGITRVPAYRGQAMPAHDPRVAKLAGVAYATSPMGADHTVGISYDQVNSNKSHLEESLKRQVFNATGDALGFCQLAAPRENKVWLIFLKDLINSRYGLSLTEENLLEIGKQTLKEELRFNQDSEFYTAHGTEPSFIRSEPLGRGKNVFDLDSSELDNIWKKLDSFKLVDDISDSEPKPNT